MKDDGFCLEWTVGGTQECSLLERVLCEARENEHVFAVVLNGSRADPAVPGDCFQDYDVIYAVDGLESFLSRPRWVDVFGPRIIMQTPESMQIPPPEGDGCFSYLILLKEGKRLDLTLVPEELLFPRLARERYNLVLWDRDGRTTEMADSLKRRGKAAEAGERPTQKLFDDCCNEFWWVIAYPAKGIWRRELPYAMKTFQYARDMLDRMLEWHIGLHSRFAMSGGREGRHFRRYLGEEFWNLYVSTYADGDYERLWDALFAACRLFRLAAVEVAGDMAITYDEEQESNVLEYLNRVRRLPPDAAFWSLE